MRQKYEILVHILTFVIGIVLLGGAFLIHSKALGSIVLLTIGTTIIATSIISGINRFFLGDPAIEIVKSVKSFSEQISNEVSFLSTGTKLGIENIYKTRAQANNEIEEAIRNAQREIDWKAIINTQLYENSTLLKLIKEKYDAGKKIRLLLLNPSVTFLDYIKTSKHDGVLAGRINASIDIFSAKISSNVVHKYNSPPQYSMVRIDNIMFVSFYLSDWSGMSAPTIKLRQVGDGLFEKFLEDFNKLWNEENKI